MTETLATTPAITVDDLKHKAIHIKDMTEAEVRLVADERMTQMVVIGVVAVLAAVSLAYYLGARRR
ncbi:MAG: hypothetical protein Q7W51_01305 [Coriobacteriia bacterium]|nr:hypothetical protein [Coriobacteriia bacterium]